MEFFCNELRELQAGRLVTNCSRLIQLRPYRDERGLLRFGGRLSQASIPATAKHPVILCGKSELADHIVKQLHTDHLHVVFRSQSFTS